MIFHGVEEGNFSFPENEHKYTDGELASNSIVYLGDDGKDKKGK